MIIVLVFQEIALNNETERKLFENEVGLLWKLRHPAIIKVEAIFYEGLRAYIQLPFVEQGRGFIENQHSTDVESTIT